MWVPSRQNFSKIRFHVSRWGIPSKIVCVARNYSLDVVERMTPIERRMSAASIFMKPASSLVPIMDHISLRGANDVICETELALLISREIPAYTQAMTDSDIMDSIGGFALAFDLTKKSVQNELKTQGKPWELAKGFDGACPISTFTEGREFPSSITLRVNGELLLDEPLSDMILPPIDLLRLITRNISLWPGDVILTGTPTAPKLPPALKPGDEVEAELCGVLKVRTNVV